MNMVIFHSLLYVYQRVPKIAMVIILIFDGDIMGIIWIAMSLRESQELERMVIPSQPMITVRKRYM